MSPENEEMSTEAEKAPADVDTGGEKSQVPSESADVKLPPGGALLPSQAVKIMGAAPTHLIVLGGPHDSGKTTLISSVYERFCQGPFAGYMFSGSTTLLGFERICYQGRVASGRHEPDTERTPRQSSRLMYHLRLRGPNEGRHQDLLFVDLSGEEFTDICDSAKVCTELQVIERADHFVLLVDGKKLIDLGLRHQAKDETYMVLRRLLETRVLSARSRVDVVFSKWDLVYDQENKEAVTAFAETIIQEMQAHFGSRFLRLRFEEVVARRPDGSRPPATGIEKLLPAWYTEARPAKPVASVTIDPLSVRREFDRFLATMPDNTGERAL